MDAKLYLMNQHMNQLASCVVLGELEKQVLDTCDAVSALRIRVYITALRGFLKQEAENIADAWERETGLRAAITDIGAVILHYDAEEEGATQ